MVWTRCGEEALLHIACGSTSAASGSGRSGSRRCGSNKPLLALRQQITAVLCEGGEISLDGTPDNTVVHVLVLMHQQSAEVDDLTSLADSCEQIGFPLGHDVQGFADEDELPLHRRTVHLWGTALQLEVPLI